MIGDRQLTGVANGSVSATSSDAVNGSQLHATNSAVAATANYATNAATGLANAVGGGASVDASGNVTNPQLTVQGQTYSTVANAVGAIDTELTTHATTINNVINNLSQAQRYVRVNGAGSDASASGQNAIAIGANTTSSGIDAIAVGTNSTASQDGAIAIGATSQATGRMPSQLARMPLPPARWRWSLMRERRTVGRHSATTQSRSAKTVRRLVPGQLRRR